MRVMIVSEGIETEETEEISLCVIDRKGEDSKLDGKEVEDDTFNVRDGRGVEVMCCVSWE